MDDDEVARLDELVEAGLGTSRSQIVRTALAEYYERHRRAQVAARIVASYRETPQSVEDDEWAADSLDDWLGAKDAAG